MKGDADAARRFLPFPRDLSPMKKCERCGASNAERARFCSNCAEPFAIAPDSPSALRPSSPPLAAQIEAPNPNALLPAPVVDSTFSNAPRVESTDDFYRALATICSTLGRVFAFLFGRFFAFLSRCAVGLWRASETPRSRFLAGTLQLGRDAARSFVYLFTPSTRWPASAAPNFLFPGVVLFFLWRRPFALVAVVYSILATEARSANAPIDARRRAASARNWIFLELLFVAIKAFFEAFGMTLPILKKLFF